MADFNVILIYINKKKMQIFSDIAQDLGLFKARMHNLGVLCNVVYVKFNTRHFLAQKNALLESLLYNYVQQYKQI